MSGNDERIRVMCPSCHKNLFYVSDFSDSMNGNLIIDLKNCSITIQGNLHEVTHEIVEEHLSTSHFTWYCVRCTDRHNHVDLNIKVLLSIINRFPIKYTERGTRMSIRLLLKRLHRGISDD